MSNDAGVVTPDSACLLSLCDNYNLYEFADLPWQQVPNGLRSFHFQEWENSQRSRKRLTKTAKIIFAPFLDLFFSRKNVTSTFRCKEKTLS